MDRHQADAAEQAAWRSSGERQTVLNGIFWVLRSGAPWRDLPTAFGPYTTCYNRFVRWRRAGVWGRIIEALATAHNAAVQMIDTSIVRVHQHGACITRNQCQSMGRSRGGLTSKIHAVVDGNGLPVRLALSPGEAHDVRLAGKLLSLNPGQRCLPTVATTRTGSGSLPRRSGRGPTSRRKAIAAIRSASALSLSCSQPGRAVLQQDQTMSSGGDALR